LDFSVDDADVQGFVDEPRGAAKIIKGGVEQNTLFSGRHMRQQYDQARVDLLPRVETSEVLGVVGDKGECPLADRRHQVPILNAAQAAIVDVRRLMAARDRDLHQ
jgi:hypothetical protein